MKPQNTKRDEKSQAVLNTDHGEFVRHRSERIRASQQKQMFKDVEQLKNDMIEVKGDVKELLRLFNTHIGN